MHHKFHKSLFIFRRDLRLEDNIGLIAALKNSRHVIPCFIFDPRQYKSNHYLSKKALQFMMQSLDELNDTLTKLGTRLYLFDGEAAKVVTQLIKETNVEAIFVNRDYTPFSTERDGQLVRLASENNVKFESCSDLLLTEVGTVLSGKRTPYTVYSHFFKRAAQIPVQMPEINNFNNYYNERVPIENPQLSEMILARCEYSEHSFAKGGRENALKILRHMRDFANYEEDRNIPAKHATTGLSAHLKFGTVSIREVYHAIKDAFGISHALISELYWRDFFSHIAYHFPHVFGHAFHRKYDEIEWSSNLKTFEAWCRGQTGFPIVDAGMRQLNATGFMHNRVRMITASFLVKDLHLDWRWGEKYFAQNLIDYDPAVNNGNWQWAASTGCDAQPYFRIFNPWIQGKKSDPDCAYIKRWVPELRSYDANSIHKLEKGANLKGYVKAIVNHSEAKDDAEDLYVAASKKSAF